VRRNPSRCSATRPTSCRNWSSAACARCRHRPDQRARSGQRLPAAGLDGGAVVRAPQERSRRHARRGQALHAHVHVEAMLAFHAQGIPTFDYGNNIRQMAKDEGCERLRVPRLRAGLRAPAVLPRHRPVPLGRAVRRSGRHLQDRRQGQGTHPRRQAPAQLARHGRRSASASRACPRASAGSASASATSSASPSTRWCATAS
jgi:hypothetical protein